MYAKQLSVGLPAPDFARETVSGANFSIAASRGHKLWITFFRHTRCLFCNLRIHEMIAHHDELSGSINMLGVFQSPPEPVREFIRDKNVPFDFISNPEEDLYVTYGLGESVTGTLLSPKLLPDLVRGYSEGMRLRFGDGTFARLPADFLIDEEGIIRHAYYGKNISDHISLDVVRDFIR